MTNFRLLVIATGIFLLGGILEHFYGHNLFAVGCLVIAAALGVAAYSARAKPSG